MFCSKFGFSKKHNRLLLCCTLLIHLWYTSVLAKGWEKVDPWLENSYLLTLPAELVSSVSILNHVCNCCLCGTWVLICLHCDAVIVHTAEIFVLCIFLLTYLLTQSTVKGMSSHAMDLVVCANPSSSSWVWVGEYFFWYRLTWVVPEKGPLNGSCVCYWLQIRKHRIHPNFANFFYFFCF